MKTFKTNPKLIRNTNYIRNQQSDIFIQKGLNKPEIQYKHKKLIPRNTFKSQYNFLEWKDTSPHLDSSIKIKQTPNNISQILNSKSDKFVKYDLNKIPGRSKKHKSFYEKMFESEPDTKFSDTEKYSNARYQRETMNLGDYEGNEYKIKKNKSDLFDPSPYLVFKSPLNRKMDLLYGGCDDLIGDYKPAINRNNKLVRSVSSIGFARRDFETRNEYDPKIINNPKEMKYFLIYGNKGIENANKKLKPMTVSRSTNNIYEPGEEPSFNRLKFLRSNIFNDKNIDKMNNDDNDKDLENNINNKGPDNETIKVNRINKFKKIGKRTKSANIFKMKDLSNISNNEDLNIKDNYAKRFLYKQNDEKLPNKLDWRDPQCYLLFPQNKNSDILKKNARQRKFKEIYGTDPIMPIRDKLCEEFQSDDRPEIDEAAKNNYKNINFSKMKRISDNISQMQGNKFINQNNRNKTNSDLINNEKKHTYEIRTTKNKQLLSNNELEKHFANKGIHIYDVREKMGTILGNKNDNKIEFKIRENNKDSNYEGKINDIKKEFKDKGLVMKEKINKKKQNTDIIPQTLKWTNPHCGLLTKNINADKSNQGITHSKPPLRRNEEEKVTRIYVNLKYKTKPYNI